jgi:hypothetical protein
MLGKSGTGEGETLVMSSMDPSDLNGLPFREDV